MKLLMLLVAEMDMVSWVVVEEDKVEIMEDKDLLLMVLIECLLEGMEGMEVEDNGSWKVLEV